MSLPHSESREQNEAGYPARAGSLPAPATSRWNRVPMGQLGHTIGMRQTAVTSGCFPANADDRKMLVLGYEGTLHAGPAPGQMGGRDCDLADGGVAACGGLPPQMETLIEPLLKNALLAFERRIPDRQRVFSGERIPVDALLELLRRRLQGILTLAVAARLATAGSSIALTVRDLTQEFSGLGSLLQQAVSEWVAATLAFHERLQRDGSRLAEWLGVGSLPPVESVSGTTSDAHPGGQVVLRIVFKGWRCIYYKPRSISGEWLWHRLLELIAEAEPALRLPAGRVLAGGIPARYGWAESVLVRDGTVGGGEGSGDGPAYWHAAGAMLCLAHHVSLTDLHLGNVIATPRGPVVTDAECLGTPRLFDSMAGGEGTKCGTFLESLMDTGLLPGRAVHGMPDISGLFGSGGPVPGLGVPRWSLESCGRFRLRVASAVLMDHGNAPGRVSPLTVLPQFLEGYRQAAGALLRCRRALMSSGSQWRSVLGKDHAPRVVVRDTLWYSLLLSESLDPRYLHSGNRRRRTLRSALQADAPDNFPGAVLRTELHSLLELHVPRLIALPGTRTLASNSGRSLVSNFARCTPAEEVVRRMEELSAESLEAVHVPAIVFAVLRTVASSQS